MAYGTNDQADDALLMIKMAPIIKRPYGGVLGGRYYGSQLGTYRAPLDTRANPYVLMR